MTWGAHGLGEKIVPHGGDGAGERMGFEEKVGAWVSPKKKDEFEERSFLGEKIGPRKDGLKGMILLRKKNDL